jgi:hypothetical protein
MFSFDQPENLDGGAGLTPRRQNDADTQSNQPCHQIQL